MVLVWRGAFQSIFLQEEGGYQYPLEKKKRQVGVVVRVGFTHRLV